MEVICVLPNHVDYLMLLVRVQKFLVVIVNSFVLDKVFIG
jgi:hypothetical protein